MEGPALRDIHLPAAPGFWPPAPGWWLLATLLLILILVATWKVRQVRRRHRRQRTVLAQLQRVRTDWQRHGDTQRLAAELSQFLRRIARASEPHSVALSGEAWMQVLREQGASLDADAQRALLQAPYRPDVIFDADRLYAQVERHTRSLLRGALRDV